MNDLLLVLLKLLSFGSNINLEGFSQVAKNAVEAFPLVRDLARSDMVRMGILVAELVAMTGVASGTVKRWFGRGESDDIPSRYLDKVVYTMRKVGYPEKCLELLEHMIQSIFRKPNKHGEKSLSQIEDEALILLSEVKQRKLNSSETFNQDDRVSLLHLSSNLHELSEQVIDKIMPGQGEIETQEVRD